MKILRIEFTYTFFFNAKLFIFNVKVQNPNAKLFYFNVKVKNKNAKLFFFNVKVQNEKCKPFLNFRS